MVDPWATTEVRLRRGTLPPDALRAACAAPWVELFLRPDGEVRSCCRNDRPLGNIATTSLSEIWASERRRELKSRLTEHDYSLGCGACGAEVGAETGSTAYPRLWDEWRDLAAGDDSWPRRIEFNLSNACNLQCVQCDGELSSSIRAHREHRPPLGRPYGESFFADLRSFIPHLRWASFAGGEPFLASENARVWSMIAELNPRLPCTVVTNATQWNRQVEQALELLSFDVTMSIDGFRPGTFEQIRVGARHAEVMRNVERFVGYCRERGTFASINHCLMRQNATELPDLLMWAEGLGLRVNVSVVRSPSACALVSLPRTELAEVVEALERRSTEVSGALSINADVWASELARLRAWVRLGSDSVRALHGVGVYRVLMFGCEGAGPTDPDDVRSELERTCVGGVATLLVSRDDTIVEASSDLEDVTGLRSEALVGGSVAALGALVDSYRSRVETADLVEATAVVAGQPLELRMLPVRDARGWAEHAIMMFARPASP